MADDRHYVPGDFYRIDDRSGFKIRAKVSRKEWTGLIVNQNLWEARQPQDFVKGVRDDQTVPDPRPRQTNVFLGPVSTFVNGQYGAGSIQIGVLSIVGMQLNDTIEIMLDTGQYFTTTVIAAPPITGGIQTIFISTPLPYSIGNAVPGNIITDLGGGSGALPPFPPPNLIPGLSLWLKADTGVFTDAGITPATNGQTVQQWNDQSENGLNAIQLSSGQQPTYLSDYLGNPAIQFTQSNQTGMVAGSSADFSDQEFSCFVVLNWPNTGSAQQMIAGVSDAQNFVPSSWSLLMGNFNGSHTWAAVQFGTFVGNTYNNDTNVGQYSGTDSIATGIRVSNSVKQAYFNGQLVSTGGDSGSALNSASFGFSVGNGGNGGSAGAFNGYVREILYYNVSLSSSDITLVHNYLLSKYGISSPSLQTMATFDQAAQANNLYAFQGYDGLNWFTPAGVTNPTFQPFGNGGQGNSNDSAGQSLLLNGDGNYYWAYEINAEAGDNDRFGIAKASSLAGPWHWVTDVVILSSPTNGFVWFPRWHFDNNGQLYILCNAGNGTATTNHQPYAVYPNDLVGLTTWGEPTELTGTGLPNDLIDCFLVPPSVAPNGLWTLWYKNDSTKNLDYVTSSSMLSGYDTVTTDPLGFGDSQSVEGPFLRKFGTMWRLYFSIGDAGPWVYVDNVAGDWATWSPSNGADYTGLFAPVTPGGQSLLMIR